jgi:peptide/nickel transport system permease protein
MRAYIIRRVLLTVPTLFLVTIIVFTTIRLIPGDVIDQMVMESLGSGGGGTVDPAAIRHKLGLDLPMYVQYMQWIGNIIVHGDFGKSLWRGTPVMDEIGAAVPVSFELGLLAIIIGLVIALPIGVYSAIRQDTPGDYVARSFAVVCIAIPSFWLGTMVMVYPSIWWHWTPSMEFVSFIQNPMANLWLFLIPSIILGMFLSGTTMRMTRTMMLEVLRQDYIRTAWAKGLKERVVVIRHALRNALIPIVTVVGLQIPILVGGAVVIEQIFGLPGIGRLMLTVLSNRDYTMLSGINVILASFILVVNLAIDLTYAWLDPRIRYR